MTFPGSGGIGGGAKSPAGIGGDSGSGFTVIEEITLASAVTEIEVTGLSLDADGVYYFQLHVLRGSVSNTNLFMRYNGDTSSTGYTRRQNASGNSANDSQFGLTASNLVGYFGNIKKTVTSGGDVEIIAAFVSADGAFDAAGIRKGFSSGTDLTQINFISSLADGFGIGTTLRILKES